jgi:hypothetical protein
MPDGNAPARTNVGVGSPIAVTVKVPAVPTVKTVLSALVMVGAIRDGGEGPLPGVHALIRNIKKTIMPTEKNLFSQQTELFIVCLALLI